MSARVFPILSTFPRTLKQLTAQYPSKESSPLLSFSITDSPDHHVYQAVSTVLSRRFCHALPSLYFTMEALCSCFNLRRDSVILDANSFSCLLLLLSPPPPRAGRQGRARTRPHVWL
ncbi:hypothetical protein E2C01_085042 [Portunus trituberculatus]|uniref:Uncharacterized protein n=1 Tax=Portunus trituberculatus TaxID=210409 RepID=A0A5B7J5M0_PORTR|nr:hypothetical protein [Portunus trituberculatus]